MSNYVWLDDAVRMFFDEKLTYAQIGQRLHEHFPSNMHKSQVKEIIRGAMRRTERYKQEHTKMMDNLCKNPCKMTYKDTGDVIYDEVIELLDGEEITPELVMKAHKLNPIDWHVASFTSNVWQSQVKGGNKINLWQSKLTVRPTNKKGIRIDDIDKHFEELSKRFKPTHVKKEYPALNDKTMVEINIADLHLGKMAWTGDSGQMYNTEIAKGIFERILNDFARQIGRPEYITFVFCNDFFNFDNPAYTTTSGTPQTNSGSWQQIFDVGVEMLANGISMLSDIAPVITFYTPSNHDEMTGYFAVKYLQAFFKENENITIDASATPRKYQLYGNTLIGYCHGDKEGAAGNKERASRLASLMPIEASTLWSDSLFREMHVAHLHSEQMIQEINGVIVRRIASPTASDTWHVQNGFVGAVRKAQAFVYDKDKGLVNIINAPV
jgi:hypothetical protein